MAEAGAALELPDTLVAGMACATDPLAGEPFQPWGPACAAPGRTVVRFAGPWRGGGGQLPPRDGRLELRFGWMVVEYPTMPAVPGLFN